MSEILQDHIESFLDDFSPETSDLNQELREYAKENHVPIIDEEVKQFLSFYLNTLKPHKILELGTAIGYSSIWMSQIKGVQELHTVEIRPEMFSLAKENIERANCKNIRQFQGNAADYLDQTQEMYDFIFIDAAKGQYPFYFKKALQCLEKNGVIAFDNILFRGMISNQALVKRRKITIVKRLRKLLAELKLDQDYEKTLIPLGDGLLLVRRNHV